MGKRGNLKVDQSRNTIMKLTKTQRKELRRILAELEIGIKELDPGDADNARISLGDISGECRLEAATTELSSFIVKN